MCGRKLQTYSVGLFKIMNQVDPNAYDLDLPPDMSISPLFKVEVQVPFRGPTIVTRNHVHYLSPDQTSPVLSRALVPLPHEPSPRANKPHRFQGPITLPFRLDPFLFFLKGPYLDPFDSNYEWPSTNQFLQLIPPLPAILIPHMREEV